MAYGVSLRKIWNWLRLWGSLQQRHGVFFSFKCYRIGLVMGGGGGGVLRK